MGDGPGKARALPTMPLTAEGFTYTLTETGMICSPNHTQERKWSPYRECREEGGQAADGHKRSSANAESQSPA
jgi:hypothetical protein